jgi:SAM-dependent methyltransferase
MESADKKSHFREKSAEIASILGDGRRMDVKQKQEYLESHGHNFFHNADLVSTETYKSLFSELDLTDKTIVNVGAGYSLSGSYNGLNPMVEGLSQSRPKVVYIPLDYNHDRTKSWSLLESNDESKSDRITLEPVTADATALPLADESIDGYLSSNLINEPRKEESEYKFVQDMLAEAYRVIKPGGFIVLSSFGYFWWELDNGQVIYNDSIDIEEIVEKEMIYKIMARVGFEEIKELPLEQSEIELLIQQRLERHPDAIKAGIRDACAFFARKNLAT